MKKKFGDVHSIVTYVFMLRWICKTLTARHFSPAFPLMFGSQSQIHYWLFVCKSAFTFGSRLSKTKMQRWQAECRSKCDHSEQRHSIAGISACLASWSSDRMAIVLIPSSFVSISIYQWKHCVSGWLIIINYGYVMIFIWFYWHILACWRGRDRGSGIQKPFSSVLQTYSHDLIRSLVKRGRPEDNEEQREVPTMKSYLL